MFDVSWVVVIVRVFFRMCFVCLCVFVFCVFVCLCFCVCLCVCFVVDTLEEHLIYDRYNSKGRMLS